MKELETGARPLKVRLVVVEASAPSEFTEALSVMVAKGAGALIILAGSMFFAHRTRLAELAAANRLPSTYAFREYAEAGGLMTYGVDLRDNFRRAAGYVDRILNGAQPGHLPIEQPTRFELVINLRTARTWAHDPMLAAGASRSDPRMTDHLQRLGLRVVCEQRRTSRSTGPRLAFAAAAGQRGVGRLGMQEGRR